MVTYAKDVSSFIRIPFKSSTECSSSGKIRANELREIIIGHSAGRHIILVNFTATDEQVRIISARKATRRERKDYEENVDS